MNVYILSMPLKRPRIDRVSISGIDGEQVAFSKQGI
jgi:hypothetical protein